MGKLDELLNKVKGRKKGDIEETKRRIEEATKYATPGTPEWTALRAAYEEEQKIENMQNEKRFLGISIDRWFGAGLVIVGLAVTLAWDTESPMAMKLSKLVMDRIRGV